MQQGYPTLPWESREVHERRGLQRSPISEKSAYVPDRLHVRPSRNGSLAYITEPTASARGSRTILPSFNCTTKKVRRSISYGLTVLRVNQGDLPCVKTHGWSSTELVA